MGQILHACAKTTPRVRKEIQESQESILKIANKYGINFKTVLKWKKSTTTQDGKLGAKKVRTVLTELEEKAICIFRKTTLHSLDDCYIALKESIPKLSRSNLHRCLKRNGLSVLPKEDEVLREKKKFREYQIGYFHIDITEILLEENKKFYLFVGIDRVTKFTVARIYRHQTIENSVEFLKQVIELCPYKIHRILTDNGSQFTYRLLAKHLRAKRFHDFDSVCKSNGIKHKLTQFKHPWTNGQVERFNRTFKDNTIKKYYYKDISELCKHLEDFMLVYNFSKKLKALKYKTPFEFMVQKYQEFPKLFYQNPLHYSRGLNR